ncbi:REX2, RNA exonuclease 2 [Dimargaris cristalligena]|uniref:REX2, RNA exonuclease 2 n=1 Tax=Dimargaris cristalligena TaxID=215637 RepID=A0A4V1J5M8_9FUNG|nr:REX2, RNA exonuclease 2 [Dimargaris cristalligena]|eukprot:RKP39609.1 REX2, RNA exonuclease 2 [Dimargaris cristalligena]
MTAVPPKSGVGHPHILWIDCEMTGLDSKKDKIIEVAAIVTDEDLNILEEGPSLVINQPKALLDSMDNWCTEQHGKTGLTRSVLESQVTTAQAERALLKFTKRHFRTPRVALLGGNSVHADRLFLAQEMPKLIGHLHYRLVDVSSVAELCRRWYPDESQAMPKKKATHRALDDIKESIEQLRYLRQNYFK